MDSIDQLAESQKLIGEEIKRICSNYKKDSSSRKTLDYIQKRIQQLDEQWDLFEANDNNIRTKYSDQLSHPYYTNSFYETIRTGYEQWRGDMETKLKALKAEAGAQKATVQQLNPINTAPIEFNVPDTNQEKTRGTVKALGAISKMPNSRATDPIIQVSIQKQHSLLKVLQRITANIPPLNQPQPEQFYHLKINTIQKYLQDAQSLHQDIWDQVNDPELAGYDIEEFFSLEEQAQNKIVELHQALSLHGPVQLQPSAQGSSLPQIQSNTSSMVKLPKVVLPRFDGDYLKWRQFCDLFTELIHNQPIADCHKMWYLKTSLCGEAEKLVRNLTTSDANYLIAWKIITDRYENTRLLSTALLNKLLSQSALTQESATGIKGLHDTTQECLLGLQALGVDTTNWDPLIVHILTKRIDKTTYSLFEQSLKEPRKLQPLKVLMEFLECRFQSLEAIGSKNKQHNDHHKGLIFSRGSTSAVSTTASCTFCHANHKLYACQKFLRLSPTKRFEHVHRSNLCINCLSSGHNVNACAARSCTKCARRHNTLLHSNMFQGANKAASTINQSQNKLESSQRQSSTTTEDNSTRSTPSGTDQSKNLTSLTTGTTSRSRGYVLLGTVLVTLANDKGLTMDCRAVLDSGSQLNLVTERVIKQLRLKTITDSTSIEGIAQRKHQAQRRANLHLLSKVNGFSIRMEAHVLPQIISPQPSERIDASSWPIPNNVALADTHFNEPGEIDLLIGAELYYSLLSVGQINLGEGLPILQNTILGWLVSGKINRTQSQEAVCGICTEDEALNYQIEKFWEVEEVERPGKNLTAAERRCETLFNHTTRRDNNGRFIVRLPFDDNPTVLGESKDIAFQRFLSIERRLSRNPDLKVQYTQFMDEYQKLGHMKEITFKETHTPYFFLPHHCIIKPDSSTTKLRVVFDGSAKTSTNVSLNNILSKGPTVQDDVFSILLRFRTPRFAFTADIEKMYRQVRVDEEDRKYQMIWWRSDPTQTLRCYQLTTVTYGTSSAPYLATRCLQQLADDETERYPLGAEILKRDFYVDDLLTGANSLQTCLEIQQQLQQILNSAGFKLRKWCANHNKLLEGIPHSDRELQLNFETKTEEHVKTIGLAWLPKSDEFSFTTTWEECKRITKRTAYSDIARLFDPLGIMGPVVVSAKIFLQRLWQLKIDWDAALPQELHTQWQKYREGLKSLNTLRFPRHIFAHRNPKSIQLHVFADASEQAYGAAAYVRSIDSQNIITVRLLCAKSRVAPIKSITLPRLELCAAKLAAELAQRIKNDLRLRNETIHLWSDSEIVLSWINSSSSSFQIFVANRISRIQEITSACQWRHVKSKENPADILSRGVAPERLASATIWFYGPMFLHGPENLWPPPFKGHTESKEEKKKAVLPTTKTENTHFIERINHKNSFNKLQRIVAYVLRFINHMRKSDQITNKSLSVVELENALAIIIKFMQQQGFGEEMTHLQRNAELPKNSPLHSLSPFMDEKGIARVGGRLESSSLSYDAKHQMLLPAGHLLTKLLLNDLHKANHHAGPQTLLAIARQRFWPIKGKTIARSVFQHCTHCARARPKTFTQLMGNLPKDRVQPARPFVNCGVDFCGPVFTHFKIRGKKPQKSYLAVFCCFATKAVHLELVTDLTTEGFIGALKRFIGRRGSCRNIYCDNATNFVGARNQINELKEMLESGQARDTITSLCSTKGMDFHFIPPRAPHFGGLWEAAVKAAKHLLQKTLISASLTYEELETVVIEIESILNSRPITSMSSNPNDLTALTPGHFLIGEPLTSSIDPVAQPQKAKLLTRWKLVTHLKSEFWRRWTQEYLNQLQHRYRWKEKQENVKPGMMVIIKEDNTPPLKWQLGRIVEAIKGTDGLVRVVDVRTANGVLRRPIHKLAPLPEEQAQEQGIEYNEPSTSKNSSSEPKRTEETPKKRLKQSCGSAIITLLLACIVLPIAKGSPIITEPFKTEPGIYFENLGPTSLASSEWDLIIFFDMQPYWAEFQALTNCSNALSIICQSLVRKDGCDNVVNHFKHITMKLEANNHLLQPVHTRYKRGAINIVVNVANALFGVLDSQYAETMASTIDNIKENEETLLQFMKNQTSVLDSTVNIIRRDQERIQEQFKVWNQHINDVTANINQIREEFYQEKMSNLFVSLALEATMTASNFQRIQGSILDILATTHHGKISSQLITPTQMSKEVTTIKNHLPASLRLPVTQDDILQLYNLMTIEGRPVSNYLIFKLKLPLLSLENFEMFSIVPVPVEKNGTFYAIRPSYPYLIVNLHRDQYYPLQKHELQSCITTSDTKNLCKQMHPIHRKGSLVSACEIALLNHMPQSSYCNVKQVQGGPHWIQLHHPNQWIYVISNKTTINIVCGDSVTQTVIKGSGILKLQQGDCTIRQELITIRGHNIFPCSTRISYLPRSNISTTNIIEHPEKLKQQVLHYQTQQEDLEALKTQIQQFDQLHLHRVQPNDIHQFTIGYLSLFLILAITAVAIWKYYKYTSDLKKTKGTETSNSKREHNTRRLNPDDFQINFDSLS